MYTLLFVLLCALALGAILRGIQSKRWILTAGGVLAGLGTLLFFWLLGFWTEVLWFSALGYGARFWKLELVRIAGGLLVGTGSLVLVALLTVKAYKTHPWTTKAAWLLAFYFGFNWGFRFWDKLLLFVHGVETGRSDPILHQDTGFYLFVLPFLNRLQALLLVLSVIAIGTYVAMLFMRVRDRSLTWSTFDETVSGTPCYRGLFLTGSFFLFVLAGGAFLDRYNLMYSTAGTVTGAGWTDVHVRLPGFAVYISLLIIVSLLLGLPPLRKRLAAGLSRQPDRPGRGSLHLLGITLLLVVGLHPIILGILPGLFQWLHVQPNEITVEKPYITHNIDFTRQAFALDRMEERQFPVSETFDQSLVDDNPQIFDNIRLWDWRALDSVYRQFQEIRLYYEFMDVDVDRYEYNGQYRQVMVSAREMRLSNLPAASQTFVNKRFKYTHGNGITLTPVNEFVQGGLPDLLIKDIPPVSRYAELEVDQPRIYYGELTDSPVLVNTEVEEFDYPQGETNVYTRYEGKGGVRLHNRWRQFLFGLRFDGTRLFVAQYPTPDSRILFDRNVIERVRKLVPFLRFDDDPYIVLVQGRLYWIIDGYTVSTDYPYSEPLGGMHLKQSSRRRSMRRYPLRTGFEGINYIRNAVKAVVNAYDGSVDFYVFEPNDPVIQTWQRVFPGLFQAQADMPEPLRAHVRYPADLLQIQGQVFAKYHMTDPAVFYNQEDLWVPATEKYYNQVQPVTPYYIMWEPPGSNEPEFVVMHPFTPKNRQVLIGWIAGMCDPGNYGRLLAFKFPKEKRVLGTQQVETKIDQDSVLSGRLSLWDQRGSRVIRGNVLAIPIEDTLLYVEPIYLQAETAAYPELRLVALMHNDRLSYGESFDEALQDLLGTAPVQASPASTGSDTLTALAREANRSFEGYLKHQGQRQFKQAAEDLDQLSATLDRMIRYHDIDDVNSPQPRADIEE
jgi:uncharacterized membrane protein (UPF0182 family)